MIQKTQEKDLGQIQAEIIKMQRFPKVKLWEAWNRLPEEKQEAIRLEWETYYEECRKSPAGENFFAQIEALKRHNIAEVKERAAWAKEIREKGIYDVKKPSSFPIDPYELEYHVREVRAYIYLTGELKRAEDKAREMAAPDAF